MYENLSQIAQPRGLVLLVIELVLVLIYEISPKNRQEFEDARRIPLNEGDE